MLIYLNSTRFPLKKEQGMLVETDLESDSVENIRKVADALAGLQFIFMDRDDIEESTKSISDLTPADRKRLYGALRDDGSLFHFTRFFDQDENIKEQAFKILKDEDLLANYAIHNEPGVYAIPEFDSVNSKAFWIIDLDKTDGVRLNSKDYRVYEEPLKKLWTPTAEGIIKSIPLEHEDKMVVDLLDTESKSDNIDSL